jgi:Ethanolamine utilization protein EutJ (predicted chaperonin)
MTEGTEVFVVDRVEGPIMIVIANDGAAREVARTTLPADIGEGAVLRVPLDEDGVPLWACAERARDLEEGLLREGRDRLDELKKRDPGGDVVL